MAALEVVVPARASRALSRLSSPTSPAPAPAQARPRPGLPPPSREQELVVELIDLQGLTQPLSDVHLRISVVRKSGESFVVLGQGQTSKRYNTRRPTWYAFRQMLPFANPTDILQFEVISDRNLRGAAKVIGTAQCTVATLGMESAICAVPLKHDANIQIRMRRVFSVPGHKRLFLVRHGESRWNRAQARRNVVGMLAFRDHPLNRTGAQQAADLNKRWRFAANVDTKRRDEDRDELNQTMDPQQLAAAAAAAMSATAAESFAARGMTTTRGAVEAAEGDASFEAGFFRAQTIFSSPLTRSLQTALLGLQHHPCALEKGITLLTCAREVQNLLGKDSMGAVCGKDCFTRASQLLQQECGDLHSGWEEGVSGVDPYDAESEWWIATKESRSSVISRTEDFINTIRYRPEKEIIVVGHSLFFKHLFQALPCELDPSRPDYAAKRALLDQLRHFKLENCGVVGMDLSFEHYWPHMRRHSSLARLLPDEAVLGGGRSFLSKSAATGPLVTGATKKTYSRSEESATMTQAGMRVNNNNNNNDSDDNDNRGSFSRDDGPSQGVIQEDCEAKASEDGDGLDSLEEQEQDVVRSQILDAASIVDVQLLFGSGLSNAPDESVDVLAQTT